jgi:hypothetical protein
MKYLLMLYEKDTNWDAVPKAELDAALAEHERFVAFLRERGQPFSGAALRPSASATTLRRSGEELVVTDGPYAELKEQIGGYYLIEAGDLDEAIAIARRCPTGAATEIRPVWGTS